MQIWKDLHEKLEKNIDVSGVFILSKPGTKRGDFFGSSKDVFKKRKRLNLSKSRYIKIVKNSTNNFDSFRGRGLEQDVIVIKKNYNIIDKVLLYHIDRLQRKGKKTIINLQNSIKKFTQINFTFTGVSLSILFLSFCYVFLSKIIIEREANAAFQELIRMQSNPYDLNFIEEKLNSAHNKLRLASLFFTPYMLMPGEKIQTAKHTLIAGENIIISLGDGVEIVKKINEFVQKKEVSEIMFSELAENIRPYLQKLENDFSGSLLHLEHISGLDENAQAQVKKVKENVKVIGNYLHILNSNYDTFLELMGHGKEKKYLLVFQNADEIRPTGGFMGSMGIVSLFRGKVKDFEKNDVYAYEWDLKSADYERQVPPEGINKITNSFGLRDANYFINVGDSAKKIKFFMEKSGYDVDGVIFINQNIIRDFLDLLGGVEYKDINKVLTKDNFSTIMSLLVESKIAKEGTLGTPKKALFDFMTDFIEKVKAEQLYSEYLKIVFQNVQRKEISFYSFDNNANNLLSQLGISGIRQNPETLDFSFPVFTSISGNKSDRYIKRSYTKRVVQKEGECDVKTSFTITQKHTFVKRDELYISNLMDEFQIQDKKYFLSLAGNAINSQFIRIVIPREAIVEEKKGLKIERTQSRQILSFYMLTEPKQTTSYEISYLLPNPFCKEYSFTLMKQAGIHEYGIDMYDAKKITKETGVNEDFIYTH